jgi:hypothetical protein
MAVAPASAAAQASEARLVLRVVLAWIVIAVSFIR